MHYSRGYQFSAHMDSPDGSKKEDAASETKQKERVNETERQQLHNTNAGDGRWLISTGWTSFGNNHDTASGSKQFRHWYHVERNFQIAEFDFEHLHFTVIPFELLHLLRYESTVPGNFDEHVRHNKDTEQQEKVRFDPDRQRTHNGRVHLQRNSVVNKDSYLFARV